MAILENGGKAAVTNYKVLENYKNEASLVQCNLETGRTHQIRVHMASIGCNLIGDQVYVKAKKSTFFKNNEFVRNFPRQALHAKSLGFIHPSTGKEMRFDSDLPEDMQELLESLRS
jgi:23S rRNA pseudouridine1911/1915/1917 synthase